MGVAGVGELAFAAVTTAAITISARQTSRTPNPTLTLIADPAYRSFEDAGKAVPMPVTVLSDFVLSGE